jgi:hypothetical protein
MENIKRYPKSKNNYQCVGPCYPPGTMVVHPTQLEFVTEGPLPFCPIDEILYEDAKTGEILRKSTDTCYNPTEKDNIDKTQLEVNILIPHIDFNAEQFLKIYYKIFSFDGAVDWIDNNQHVPMGTKVRVINCAIEAFGDTMELFDIRFCNFFIDYVKLKKIKTLYSQIHENIGIDEKTGDILIVDKQSNKLGLFDKSVERINYIIKTFINKEEITKFLQKYFKKSPDHLSFEDNHLNKMSNDLIIYISNKIGATIKT